MQVKLRYANVADYYVGRVSKQFCLRATCYNITNTGFSCHKKLYVSKKILKKVDIINSNSREDISAFSA